MKVLVPTPITDTSLIDSSAGALIGTSVADNSYPLWVSSAEYKKGLRYVYSGNLYEALRRVRIGRAATPDVDTFNWKLIGAITSSAAWAPGSVHAIGDRVYYNGTHRVYQCLAATGAGQTTPPDQDPAYWVDVGPMNPWACFDQSAGTRTAAASPLVITIKPGIIDSLAILGLVGATSVTVEMKDGSTTVYLKTVNVADTQTLTSWYDYCFLPIIPQTDFVLDDLPPYLNGQITITITGASSVGVGSIVPGRSVAIGRANYGAQTGIVDYSVKSTDDFGVTSLVERSYADKLNVDCWIEQSTLDYMKRTLASLRATPSVYYDESGYQALIVYGYYDDLTIAVQYPQYSLVSLSLKGLA